MQGTGPPEKMAENREDLTPMMSQYFELCSAFEDSLVLFQVGDFYEAFCEAAEISARLLEITLTKREDSSGTYPMAGIPIDNASSYIETLLDAGYRVAVADQVQDPSEASGVVDRAVTRVVTPGTVLDDELLADEPNNYLACLTAATEATGSDASTDDTPTNAVAFLDLSTGEFRVTSSERATVQDELDRLDPSEVITGPETGEAFAIDGMQTAFRADAFDPDTATERVGSYVPTPAAVFDSRAELRACGALLAYAEYTQGEATGGLDYITRITRYTPEAAMRLDATALESLELFENRDGGDEHTLLGVLDETACVLGRRTLTHWLRRPLLDPTAIERRHDAVAELGDRSLLREEMRELLYDVYDIERLITRVSRDRANARDLRSLKSTLDVVPELKAVLADAECGPLVEHRAALDELEDIRNLIHRTVREEPPIEVTEGDVIQAGYDEELDALRATERDGREWVADLEARERERTGIDSLKVGYNEVHGYYIEVTNPNLDRVPEEYTRRQTLKNAERFYTPDLKRREDEIIGAAERADELEYQLFTEVRSEVAEAAERVQHVASVLAELDVLCALAHVATEREYIRPTFTDDGIHIDGGRHPVVETTQETFVPNDTDLTEERLAVVTGPNMSGKSTYMRQVALIVLLAQMGSFVPADAARLPVVDRIFTRVGASDDIAGGQSTFMREMTELSDILHNATDRSLVLLDEVGRGTSTADGRAIAWAVTEFIHDEISATTLFATHYHDLTRIAEHRTDVMNLHFTVDRSGEEMTFLHTAVAGASEASYGIEVARLAGVPASVIERSRTLLADGLPSGPDHEHPDAEPATNERANGHTQPPASAETDSDSPVRTLSQRENGHGSNDVVREIESEVRELSIADMTPLEALRTLNDFQRRIDDRQR